jgi:hypothetical protein
VGGQVDVRGVSGDTTLVGLAGPVRADTVSGTLEAQALTGDLRFNSISGDLTVVEAGSSVKAESVSGSMIVDLDPAARRTDVSLTSVSGEIAIRLPQPADAEVEAHTAGGTVSSAFEDLRVGGPWGAKRITGRLGAGNGSLKATTVSGSIALLRRPPEEPEPWETEARETEARETEPWETEAPDGDSPGASGENAAAGPGDDPSTTTDSTTDSTSDPTSDPTSAPADGTTDKKVL